MIELTDANFSKEVLDKGGKVVVDCWATWCGKCKMVKPIFAELESKKPEYKFCSLDIDKAPNATTSLQVGNLPTFIVFENSKEIKRGGVEVLNSL